MPQHSRSERDVFVPSVTNLNTPGADGRDLRCATARHGGCTIACVGSSGHKPRRTTLLDLLVELQAQGPYSEEALVALALSLIRSGRVVLCGTYGTALEAGKPASAPRHRS